MPPPVVIVAFAPHGICAFGAATRSLHGSRYTAAHERVQAHRPARIHRRDGSRGPRGLPELRTGDGDGNGLYEQTGPLLESDTDAGVRRPTAPDADVPALQDPVTHALPVALGTGVALVDKTRLDAGGSERLRSLLKKIQVSVVTEQTIAAASGYLSDDPEAGKAQQGGRDSRSGETALSNQSTNRCNRPSLKRLVNSKGGPGGSTKIPDLAPITPKDFGQRTSGRCCTLGSHADTVRKESNPLFPFPVASHAIEPLVILRPILLEVETQVEKRVSQDPVQAEEQRYE